LGYQFEHLDVNVQEEFEKFLRERGIAEGLALFIPEYAEHKEQKVRFAPYFVSLS
jgi:complement component 1 Q subcomponent-binding protein, mitochondrial